MSELNTQPTEARRAEIAAARDLILRAAKVFAEAKALEEKGEALTGNMQPHLCGATYRARQLLEDAVDSELSRLTAELARQTAMVPEGYVLVPAQPTQEMTDAGIAFANDEARICVPGSVAYVRRTYRVMIAARPTPAEACPSCSGTGEFQGGRMMLQKPLCPDCKGSGIVCPTPAAIGEGK